MIKDKVYELLKTLKYPVKWQVRPKLDKANTAVISFHFFNQVDSLYGNGKGLEQGGALQIDVFSFTDYTKAVEEIKKLFVNNKFRFAEMYDDIEEIGNNQVFHKIIIFNYTESEVL